MSAETKHVLDTAIAAHFADENDDAFVSGYVLQIVGSTIEDVMERQARYLRCNWPNQSLMMTAGIVQWLHQKIQRHLLELTP